MTASIRILFATLLLGCFASWEFALTEDALECLSRDLKLLQDAGVATDGPGLVEFFRKQTMSEEQRRGVGELIVQLGDDKFDVREKATAQLIALGPAAVPALQRALNQRDAEVLNRVRLCLDKLKSSRAGELRAAAARVLAVRKPLRAVEALLAFLPEAVGREEEEAAFRALTVLGIRDRIPDPALVAALTDELAVRRAVAAEVLAGMGDGKYLPAIRKLYKDPNPAVRQWVAVALVYAGDKEAVPVLIELVADLPSGRTSEAKELLHRLSGVKAPQVRPGNDAAAREEYRAALKAWWKVHGATVNLAQLDAAPPQKAKVSARASATWKADVTADRPFDLVGSTGWNAGAHAPQWIEADLGSSAQLASIVLTVGQLPAGQTTHEVWAANEPIGQDRAKAKLAHTFKGNTEHDQRLQFYFPKGSHARYVQIRTIQSPSWVAWVAIELHVGRMRSRFMTADGK